MNTRPVFRFAIHLIILVVALPSLLRAGVTNVTHGGPEYATLAPALDAALNGDELRVSTGWYAGNMTGWSRWPRFGDFGPLSGHFAASPIA